MSTRNLPRNLLFIGLGELLWDELPDGRRLGGAPANFAVMAARLGAHGTVASRLGQDEPGDAARAELARLPVDSRFLQSDPERPTGTVSVEMKDGQPAYTIHAPVAWDALAFTPAWQELAGRADAVCWGTLAQRDAVSEATIHAFLAATRRDCLRIFDINLREPFFTAEPLVRSLGKATLLKLNDGEMPHLLTLAGLPGAPDWDANTDKISFLLTGAHTLLNAYPALELVAVTLGAEGSLLVTREAELRHRGIPCAFVDAVGAGDAFTAALAVHRLRGASLAVQNEAANRWGSWVASQAGAMPALTPELLARVEQQIEDAAGQ